jgi:hypothetical protein
MQKQRSRGLTATPEGRHDLSCDCEVQLHAQRRMANGDAIGESSLVQALGIAHYISLLRKSMTTNCSPPDLRVLFFFPIQLSLR